MPEKPAFTILRDLDQAVEKEIAKYLDEHLYVTPNFDSIKRVSDMAAQRAGEDLIVTSAKLGLKDAVIDEKSASHFVNSTSLHTFAFELSFFRKDLNGRYTILTEGWLMAEEKKTDYYLLVWPFAQKDRIINYEFRNKKYPYFTAEDITHLEYALVSKETIRNYLIEEGFDEKWLGITMSTIRKHAAAQEYAYFKEKFRKLDFACSAQLREKPVNVLIEKETLFELALLSGTC